MKNLLILTTPIIAFLFLAVSFSHAFSISRTIEEESELADVVIIGKILDVTEGPLTERGDGERIMFLKVQVKDELKYHTYGQKVILILFTCSYRLKDDTSTRWTNDFGKFDLSDIKKEYLFFLDQVPVLNGNGGYNPYYTYDNSYEIKNNKINILKDYVKNTRSEESLEGIIKSIKKKYK